MGVYEFLDVGIRDGIATVRMNRPPLNVMNNALMDEFNAALEPLVGDPAVAAIVIRADGRAFCAGVDVADHTAEKVGAMIHRFHGIFRKLARTDALTIAVVQGAALGGGCELACFCDIILASEKAKFGQPEVQVGVFPPVAACVLPERVGLGHAIEMTALGTTFGAADAYRIGLVNRVFPVETFEVDADAFVAQVCKLSRPVVRLAKRAVMMGVRDRLSKQLDEVESLYLKDLMALSDAHEGIAAFLEKRPPNWTHG